MAVKLFPPRLTSQHIQEHAAAAYHLIMPKAGAGAVDAPAILQHVAHPFTRQTTLVKMGLVK